MSWDTLDKIPTEAAMGDERKFSRKELVQAAATEWVELDSNHWLAVVDDGGAISYGLYSFAMSDGDGSNAYVQCVFRGNGFSGALREMRHTWFNPDEGDMAGYVFYLPIDATIKALTHLRKYFDG